MHINRFESIISQHFVMSNSLLTNDITVTSPMKILYIMNNGKRHESIQPIGCILCKKDNGILLNHKIIEYL